MKTAKPVPMAFQTRRRALVLLGGFRETTEAEFGASQYAKVILNQLWGLPPKLDMDYEKRVHDAMREIVAAGLAESAHDLSDGGLAVALAESSHVRPSEPKIKCRTGASACALFFHEAPSRILISTRQPETKSNHNRQNKSIESVLIGVTMKGRLQSEHGDQIVDRRSHRPT